MFVGRRSLLVAASVLMAVASAACTASKVDDSASGASGDEVAAAYPLTDEGIAASFRDHMTRVDDNLNLWVPTDAEADCAATRLVERFGANRLIAMGYDPDDGRLVLAYEPAERSATVNILSGCIDVSRGLLEMMSSYSKTPLSSAECLTRGIESEGLTRVYVESLVDGVEPEVLEGPQELGRRVAELMGKCMDVDDLDPLLDLPKYPGAFDSSSATTTVPDPESTPLTAPEEPGADGVVPAGGG